MTTSLTTDLQTTWEEWHSVRERELATPHGWLSLTSFHWLPVEPAALPGLPGLYSVQNGQAVLTAESADGYAIAGDSGTPIDGTVRATVAEAKSLVWLSRADVAVELALRGGRYTIRTRDPKAVTRTQFTGVPAFGVDRRWLVEGRFEPFDQPRLISVLTARHDLVQQITGVGTVELDLDGTKYSLIATAGGAGTLNISFHDSTNGAETARWRAVSTSAPDNAGRVEVDFNRAINFPYAFTDYGTCPAPPAGNTLPVEITAGERAPRAVGQ